MKKISVLLLSAAAFFTANAQFSRIEFDKTIKDGDTVTQKNILDAWERSNDRSADYYICNFNYYINQSRDNSLQFFAEEPQEGRFLSFKDSADAVVGYLTEGGMDASLFGNAIKYVDEGISKYPDRLDIRLGKIYAYYMAYMWDEYTEELIKTIDYSDKNKNKWQYPGEKADKDFFLATVQAYLVYLYEDIDFYEYSKEDSLQVLRMRKISKEVLKYYPDNVEALSNVGVTYFLDYDYPNALDYFLKAEKVNPKDAVVLFNIANVYAKQGNKQKAEQYYKNIIKNCDSEAARQAEELMKELQ